jgi:hypothetical protein
MDFPKMSAANLWVYIQWLCWAGLFPALGNDHESHPPATATSSCRDLPGTLQHRLVFLSSVYGLDRLHWSLRAHGTAWAAQVDDARGVHPKHTSGGVQGHIVRDQV